MAMAEVTDASEALQLLARVDFGACEPGERRRALAELGRMESYFVAARSALIGEWDGQKDWARYGHASSAASVRKVAKVPAPAARKLVAEGRALREMPHVAAAMAEGWLTPSHASRLRVTAQRESFAALGEKLLVEQARHLNWKDWLEVVKHWEGLADAEQSDPGMPDQDPRDQRAEFHASKGFEGVGNLLGTLGPEGFEAFEEALHRIEQDLFRAEWKALVDQHGHRASPSLMRPAARRRADALVEMAHRSLTAPKDGLRPLPLVVIHTDVDTFNRELARVVGIEAPEALGTTRMCELDSGTTVAPSAMVRAALHGTVRRLVYESPSHVLDYGTDVRLFRGKLREAIIHAARTCTDDGCDIRASRCEVDHRIPATVGGPTAAWNGQPKCRADHRHKTRTDPA